MKITQCGEYMADIGGYLMDILKRKPLGYTGVCNALEEKGFQSIESQEGGIAFTNKRLKIILGEDVRVIHANGVDKNDFSYSSALKDLFRLY